MYEDLLFCTFLFWPWSIFEQYSCVLALFPCMHGGFVVYIVGLHMSTLLLTH